MTLGEPISFVLTYVILPIWILAGFADYLCHRASHISQANGAKESALHWLLLAEIGIPLAAATFLKINALMLVFFGVCIAAHELTTHWDLRVALLTRTVTAFEQQVHSVLEGAPVAAAILMFILHWEQAKALFGQGAESADFTLALESPKNMIAMITIFAAALIFLAAPYAEEFIRGARARR
jgi:hypothetical protein